ncbi:MAG TPA: Hpt domain-containing protein [Nitrospira sp.]|jgi:hypothetical protein|nr:Hpt domain-containing protein [Nitrospira sp.]
MHNQEPQPMDHFTVRIDRELEGIVPVFLANRRKDLQTIRHSLSQQDFETIQMLSHRMKGDGGGYGFDRITEIGGIMELAASRRDRTAIEEHTTALEDFLARVSIVYV